MRAGSRDRSSDGVRGWSLELRVPQLGTLDPGARATLPDVRVSVRVDGSPWEQVQTLESAEPDDDVFAVSRSDDGAILVQFGDGECGSRLPTGVEHISAHFRAGGGSAGTAPEEEDRGGLDSLIYLDVCTEEVSAIEDVELREPALGGPDTSIRGQSSGSESDNGHCAQRGLPLLRSRQGSGRGRVGEDLTLARDVEVRDCLSPAQVDDLLRLYANEWWTAQRTRPDVERMLAASDLLFAVVEKESGSLVAFARVLTDRTYLALVLDVIVAPEHRGAGLGTLLVDSICAEPALRNVASIDLVCQPEHVTLYQKWGFTENVGRSRLMRRTADRRLADATPPASVAPEASTQ